MNPEVFVIALGDGTFVAIDSGSGYPSFMAFNYAKMFGKKDDAELYAKCFSSDFVEQHQGYEIKQVTGFVYKEEVPELKNITCSELKPGMIVEIPESWEKKVASDFDPGCRAKVAGITKKDQDGVVTLVLDWSDYQDYNKERFNANYYDSNHVPCLKFHETNGFCEKDITSMVVYTESDTEILLVGGVK